MTRSEWLTDELIQAAFERRAGRASPGDLRDMILVLSAATNQRRAWGSGLPGAVAGRRGPRSLPFRLAVAAAIGVLAVGAASYLVQPDPPTVGGPSHSPPPSPSVVPSSLQPGAASWTGTAAMIAPRAGQTATLLADGRVLVAGGLSPTIDSSTASTELFDPGTGSWSATGAMSVARAGQSATVLSDGRVLVAGGTTLGGLSAVASAELYDPGSGTWDKTGDMLVTGRGHTATLLPDGTVLVAGSDSDLSLAELFDPVTGSWRSTDRMNGARTGHTATLLADGTVLVAGGFNFLSGRGVGSTAELYEPASRTWVETGGLGAGRSGHSATLLPDGRVLVAGGVGIEGEWLVSAELYDPGTRSWTATANMAAVVGDGDTATLLPDGRVLVVGGATGPGGIGAMTSAQLYDPATGTWALAPSMSTARSSAAAILLPDGRVLVLGGIGNDPNIPLASAELYDPGNGS